MVWYLWAQLHCGRAFLSLLPVHPGRCRERRAYRGRALATTATAYSATPNRPIASLDGVERLIFVTQLIDPDDPVLGFVVSQVRSLSTHADVLVIANEVRSVPDLLGAEVISLGKERGRHKAARGLRYFSAIGSELRRTPRSAILAHMCPIYLTLAAPLARTYRIPTMLWFVHPADTMTLRTAERLSDAVVTALPGSYPRPGPKVEAIGHAIDTDAFAWSALRPRDPNSLRLLALGRTSPVKGYDVMIRAVAAARHAGVSAELRIVGPSVTGLERRHREELRVLAAQCAPGAVHFDDGVPRAEVAALLCSADVVVNATDPGSADKVVFEAMAAGRPVLASSPAFGPLLADSPLPLSFPNRDARVLADRIRMIASAPTDEIMRASRMLRRRIELEHSIQHWATNVLRVATELSARRKASRAVNG
jgi:glycosyltransferase involved in cell wall biosynthesis